MATTSASTLGSLLRRYRSQAALTQEELAERAELSVRVISDLERGANTTPRPFTIRRLADALALSDSDRAALHRAALTPADSTDSPASQLRGRFLGSFPETNLIGRDPEVARICSILDSVAEGKGHLLLVAGEPASGKTRLLQELTVHAGDRGFAVLTGTCTLDDLNRLYHPLLEAFAPSTSSISVAADLEAEKGWRAISDLAAGTGSDLQVATALAGSLTRSAQSVPVALVLDDLQWADPQTLSVLLALARSTGASQTLLAGAFSDVNLADTNPALAATLQRLSRDRLAQYITLRPLSLEETSALVAELMGQSEVSEEFAGFVYRRTKGSPRLIDELIRSLGGRLDLEGEIGAGSMGRVFRAYDRETDRIVAAKLVLARAGIDLDDLLRFQQEGAILRSLDHPNIVRIYDSFAEEHVACIVMELLEGRSLARELDNGPLDLDRAKSIAERTAGALSYAHVQSIVHRDVKPDNIMILDEDQVKVTDFGIARILSVDTMMGTIATTGMRVGTPLYMSPEQVRGKNVDARSDVYGFGAVLYHMVTGRPPFDGDDALAIAVQQMHDEPTPPSSVRHGLPADWDTLILKSLHKDPRRRFQSMKEMKRGIEVLGTDPASRPTRLVRKPWYAVATAVVVVAVVLASLLGYASMPGHVSAATLSSYLSGAAAQGRLSGTVLVARHGKVILDQGYGMANRAVHIPNRPNTEYGLADATTTTLLTANDLQSPSLKPGSGAYSLGSHPLCSTVTVAFVGPTNLLGGHCPKQWRRITLDELVSGTAGLPEYRWGRNGNGIAQTERGCWSLPLAPSSPRRVDYTTCGNVLMAVVSPDGNADSPWGTWLPSGLIPRTGSNLQLDFTGAPYNGLRLAWQLFDGMPSRHLALDYDSAGNHVNHEYNDYFAAYSSALNMYRWDNRLFGGRFMPAAETKLELSPRGIPAPTDPGIQRAEWADGWKVGSLFGSRVEYTAGNLYSYQTANLRFPHAGVTVIVMANTSSTDALNTAEHAAAFVLRGKQARFAATGPATTADLQGVYRRSVLSGDAAAIEPAWNNGFFLAMGYPFVHQKLSLTIDRSHFRLGDVERYSATNSGGLTVFGPPPGLRTAHFCTGQKTDLTPTGFYHWSLLGRALTITKVSDNFCSDRAQLIPGTWIKVHGIAGA